MGKTLYGKVEKNEFNYEWKSEPGACEVCQKMDGTIYESADDIPAKPHPNCKCWINLVEKEKPSPADPIVARRAAAKDRINAQKELAKLHGDVRVIQDEVEIYINDLDNKKNELEDFIKSLEWEKINLNDKNKIIEIQDKIYTTKLDGEQVKKEAKILENKISSSSGKLYSISKLHFEVKNLQENLDNFQKAVFDKGIDIAAIAPCLEESGKLWKASITRLKEGLDEIDKNSRIYNKIEEINDKNLENFIRKKVQKQLEKNDLRGVKFTSQSSIAQKIANSRAIKNYVKSNKSKFLPMATLDSTSLDFSLINLDLYNSLHKADIIDIKIEEDYTFSAKIIDTYDFNKNSKNPLVMIARHYQDEGKIENYYTIIEIRIPITEWIKF